VLGIVFGMILARFLLLWDRQPQTMLT
jgi:hypothetical protein